MTSKAILALADGTIFYGTSIGVTGKTLGEVVFHTSMTGYQEIITDPSYAEQIICFTYPHIGNTGINSEDWESNKIHAKGVIIRNLAKTASNFRSSISFQDFLKQQNLLAIADIDTRKLTKILRTNGAQNGCILAKNPNEEITQADIDDAIASAKRHCSLENMDLAKVVTCEKPYDWTQGSWKLGVGFPEVKPTAGLRVVVYDFGIKYSILRLLADQGFELKVVPATTDAKTAMALKPDGIFLSNGPGDPAACDYAISAIQEFLQAKIPMFGICLGHQLLALASGGATEKMKFGHHGGNHPVADLDTSRVLISSQNHGFAVADSPLPSCLRKTHISLFDGTIQGLEHKESPAFSFQGHPEAGPGPADLTELFGMFHKFMKENKA